MARTDIPTPQEWQELHNMAFAAEQAIADIIAICKVTASGLSDSIEVFDGQGQHSMFDAKHSIIALTRLLECVYDDAIYPLSMQLHDVITDMQPATEPPSEGGDHA